MSSRRRLCGRRGGLVHGNAAWIGPAATATPSSTGSPCVRRAVLIGAPRAGCGPNRSATLVAPGRRVPKTLAQRTYDCPACGLCADRDVVSAALAACVNFTDPDDASTARVDYELAHAVGVGLASQQEAGAQSTGTSHQQHRPAGPARTGSHNLVASAEQAIHPSAYPRTDQHRWTSRGQPDTKPPKGSRWEHDKLHVNS